MKPLSPADSNHILFLLDSGYSGEQISSQTEFPMLLSPDYASDIVPTSKKLLEVIHPSFLILTYIMLYILLDQEKLIMLSKSQNPLRTSPINLSLHKQFEMGSKKWE
jgi:hypothetical protein